MRVAFTVNLKLKTISPIHLADNTVSINDDSVDDLNDFLQQFRAFAKKYEDET